MLGLGLVVRLVRVKVKIRAKAMINGYG